MKFSDKAEQKKQEKKDLLTKKSSDLIWLDESLKDDEGQLCTLVIFGCILSCVHLLAVTNSHPFQ